MNQYRCETCNHKDNGWCELLNRILYFNESDFISEVGCASHSDYQSERDCPVCGGGLMCHRWCIDRDCGWDSIKGTPAGRLTMNRYIITEEDICTIRDYVLGAFYEGENKEKIYDLLESQFSVMRSHPYQSERDCPVCGGGLMCHRWCIDRDCGWDSIKGTPAGR